MMRFTSRWVAAGAVAALVALGGGEPVAGQEGFRFKSGVELINVTATVIDRTGRFAGGLRQDDFVVYEDDKPVEVTHFSAERTPVSLGIVLDTSGSMAGEKIEAARDAIDRFLGALPDPQDEFFMYRFSADPYLVNDWTSDRQVVSRNLARVYPTGGTAMYDAVAEAVPMAQGGQNRKKAIVLISDGNDTNSRVECARSASRWCAKPKCWSTRSASTVRANRRFRAGRRRRSCDRRRRFRSRFPAAAASRAGCRFRCRSMPRSGGGTISRGADDRVNVVALREITDDSGGRTEIVRDPRDLDPATLSIADELSKQYYIGYPSPGHRDGRWHNIRVEVRDRRAQGSRASRLRRHTLTEVPKFRGFRVPRLPRFGFETSEPRTSNRPRNVDQPPHSRTSEPLEPDSGLISRPLPSFSATVLSPASDKKQTPFR